MQSENLENRIELNRYEIAIKDILELGYSRTKAALAYELDEDYLSMFLHTISSKGKVIKGENKSLSFFDELAFLVYVKICPQGHCVCIACFKEYFPHLIYKFVKKNKIIYPYYWNVCRKADTITKSNFLKRYKYEISRLFSKDCIRLSSNNLLQKSLYLDDDVHECPQNFYAHNHAIFEQPQVGSTQSGTFSKYNIIHANIIILKDNPVDINFRQK